MIPHVGIQARTNESNEMNSHPAHQYVDSNIQLTKKLINSWAKWRVVQDVVQQYYILDLYTRLKEISLKHS